MSTTVRFVAHSCIVVEDDRGDLLMDPWLFGNTFHDSWALRAAPDLDVLERRVDDIHHAGETGFVLVGVVAEKLAVARLVAGAKAQILRHQEHFDGATHVPEVAGTPAPIHRPVGDVAAEIDPAARAQRRCDRPKW